MQFELTPKLSKAAAKALDSPQVAHPWIRESLASYSEYQPDKTIPFEAIQQISSILLKENHDQSEYHLFSLLKGSQMSLTPPPLREKSPQLLKILQQAQQQIDEKEYERMTYHVQPKSRDSFSEYKSTLGQMSSVANVLLSMLAVFVTVFYFGDQVTLGNTGFKVLLSLLGALIVGIAEGYFLCKDLLLQDS